MDHTERIRQGGSAFPTFGYGDGMTLRDWFAGQALAGMTVDTGGVKISGIAEDCYRFADAMLAERNRRIEAAKAVSGE